MGEIANQLGQLLVQSLPTIVLVIFLVAFLSRVFFKPLSRTLEARAKATSGAIADARQHAEKAESRMAEYERSLQAARQEIYQHREEVRHDSLSKRDIRIHEARSIAESTVNEAQTGLQKEIAAAKVELQTAVESLAAEVTDALFTPHDAPGSRGGVRA